MHAYFYYVYHFCDNYNNVGQTYEENESNGSTKKATDCQLHKENDKG